MGRLILVRHAQASFLAPDYDRLSDIGETQARLLGEYWARRNVVFDGVYSGPRARQKDTAKIVAETFQSMQLRFPASVAMQEFDEFEAEAVLKQALPQLLDGDTGVCQLHQAYLASKSASEKRKSFQKLLEVVIGKWVEGEIAVPGVESWPEFCARVNRGLSQIMSDARSSEQVVVFSSGGPIAVAMRRSLNLSPQDTLRAAWMSRNCSYSEFLFSAGRFTLSVFNAFPHLDDGALLTYR
jgi:broad specificity phosphatase PhoE